MANVISWLSAHWKDVALSVLAIDQALINILPNVPLLSKIRDWISAILPKS